ncbi:MAG: hypothetical protein FJ118_01240 [Deltaproteobacteria bacterium]|nr:hypothetical protein [Deltaproteobacteria bacterium]
MKLFEIGDLLVQCRKRTALVDSNLLLLYFIGKYDLNYVGKFKRTKSFSLKDFAVLQQLIRSFKHTVTTLNILTEVINFAGQLGEPAREQCLAKIAEEIKLVPEEYVPSTLASQHPYFAKCGLTDAVIMHAASNKHMVVTTDFTLASLLEAQTIDVINFNHIRTLYYVS